MSFDITTKDVNGYTSEFVYPHFSNQAKFWVLTKSQLTNITSSIFDPRGSNNVFDNFGKALFNADPQKALISLRAYPLDLSYLVASSSSPFTLMTQSISGMTSALYLSDERALNDYDFGYIDVPYVDSADSYLSYSPHSIYKLYLPFVSNLVELDTRRVAGKTINVVGVINFYDGTMTYYVTAGTGVRTSPTYEYEYITSVTTKIAIDIPLYQNNTMSVLKQATSNAISGFGKLLGGVASGNAGAILNSGFQNLAQDISLEEGKNKLISEDASAFDGLFLPLQPKLLIYKPRLRYNLNDTNYAHAYGLPCKKIDILGEFGGFTKVDEVHIKEIAGATQTEIEEIEKLLHSGIILDNTNAVFNIYTDVRNASLSNQATTIQFGWTYQCDVTATSGYQLDSIQVFMGGQDVTSTAVSGNHIYLPNVSADIRVIVRASVIPVYHTITFSVTGATSSSQVTQVLTGQSYSTDILPDYNNGYILGTYEPIITMGGIVQTTAYANGQVYIQNVQDDIVITGTLPHVTTMTDLWRRRQNALVLPDVTIDLMGIDLVFEDDTSFAKNTNTCIIDNMTDLEGNFITFTSGGDSYTIDIYGRIYENDVYVTTLTKINFVTNYDYYTNFSGLLKWLDTIAYISLT